ncbi:hypothetical protein AYM02_01155 [Coxiella burnetii]|uniref:SPOR domain-containing protein n=1 Tax=Coxiella burnetii TaxID=777 RepID=UPI0002D334B1|nr:hypothetical protein [Coxiella burnetii]AML47985.1 hypothetical protein AUR58_01440 [Coxiella burnetii]AML54011.1 hypothetical protein AYM38_01135 [Coxiella burnetii]ATN67971.1 hypothetical protein AYM00_01170 [Coxiella burnetii]ATN69899.1 hypothetical protein AYM02_01155 [Coxiella burnetii]ATN71858.1 hypothetical protein AYM11_01125 [Coxiella burnetii]
MPTLVKDDGTPFALQAYREVLIGDRASVYKRIRLLAERHGHFVHILKRYTDHYEIAFSPQPGYLLGESIKHYFGWAQNLIFCERLPHRPELLLVVIREGRVYLDSLVLANKVAAKLMPLLSDTQPYQIVTSGEVPIQQSSDEKEVFVPPPYLVDSFEELNEPLFPRLPAISSLQLLPLSLVLKTSEINNGLPRGKFCGSFFSKKIAVFLISLLMIFIGAGVGFWFNPFSKLGRLAEITSPFTPDHICAYQQKYLTLVKQYKIAKIERQLLDEKVAIAAARKRLADLNIPSSQNKRVIKNITPLNRDEQAEPYTLDEILLLELPPTNYSIRIKDSYDKQSLITFAKNNALAKDAIYYSYFHNRKKWYVLLYNYYHSKMDAHDAALKLLKKIKTEHIEIINLSLIQSKIKSRKNRVNSSFLKGGELGFSPQAEMKLQR